MTRLLLGAVLAISGLVIASRTAVGPLTFPIRVNSPLNSESCFAVAGLLLLLTGAKPASSADGQRRFPDRFDALAMLTIILMVAGAFWRSAHSYFLSDDFLLLKHARSAWHNLAAVFTVGGGDGFFRPAGYAFYALSSTWAGIDPARWHWIGFALHAANAVLVLWFVWTLGLSRFAGWFAAALFAIQAGSPEAVLWMAGRFDLLATFFTLLALVFFMLSAAGGIVYRCASLAATALALLSKESAYALPFLLALLAWNQPWKKRGWVLAPYFIVAAGLFAYRWTLLGGIGGYIGNAPEPVSMLKILALRLWAILFFPINWTIHPGPVLAIVTAAYLCCLFFLFTSRVARNRLILPLGFILIAALPPIQQLLIGSDLQKSRLLYLPSVGFCLLLAMASDHVKPRLRWASAAAVLVFNFVALWHNLAAWEDASSKVLAACSAAAACEHPTVSGLPGSLNGVYFLANGFPECVAMQRKTPSHGTCPETPRN